jgi:uncharacterized protein
VKVSIVFADTQRARQETLELRSGALLQDALAASALAVAVMREVQGISVGIWNHVRSPDTPLEEGDRIELYKPLVADPKEARRTRVARSREEAQKKRDAARKVTRSE